MVFHIATFLSILATSGVHYLNRTPSANGCTEFQQHALEVTQLKESHHGTVILTIDGHQFILTGTLKHHPYCNCYEDEAMYGG